MKKAKYNIIYVDPPWRYNDSANSGKRGAEHKYQTMSLSQLCQLPVGELADDNCLLAMWYTGAFIEEALFLARAWGFKFFNAKGFTWHKTTKTGKSKMGMGTLTRANTEDVLFAKKGIVKRIDAGVRQFIEAEIRDHSQKPDEVRDALVQLMGDVPRIELFARDHYEGWHVWGNEIISDVNLVQEWRLTEDLPLKM
jgi:N6-adenosine-specific RNA methylase IME4